MSRQFAEWLNDFSRHFEGIKSSYASVARTFADLDLLQTETYTSSVAKSPVVYGALVQDVCMGLELISAESRMNALQAPRPIAADVDAVFFIILVHSHCL